MSFKLEFLRTVYAFMTDRIKFQYLLNKYSSIYSLSLATICSVFKVSIVTLSCRSPNLIISCCELVASICSDRCNCCDSSLVMCVFRLFMMAATLKISSCPLVSLWFSQSGYAK